MTRRTFVFALTACLFLSLSNVVLATSLEGAWQLKRYSLAGEWVDVSGLLILNDGMFAMIYSMEPDSGPLSGRAHAGTYRVNGDRLVFDVREWVQKVGDNATVVPPKIAGANLERTGDDLTLHFDGGSLQILERVQPEDADGFAGVWHLEGTDRSDLDSPSSGLMVAEADRLVVVWLDNERGGYAAGGNARNVKANESVDLSWEIRVEDDSGSVCAGDDCRDLQMNTTEHALLLRGVDGTVLRFHN